MHLLYFTCALESLRFPSPDTLSGLGIVCQFRILMDYKFVS